MDNPETLAILDTQDTGQRQTKQGTIKNGQSRDTGTQDKDKQNNTQDTGQRQTKQGDQECTIQRHWQH